MREGQQQGGNCLVLPWLQLPAAPRQPTQPPPPAPQQPLCNQRLCIRRANQPVHRTLAPVASSNSAMDPTTTTSSKSSDTQMGMGVPQKREREMACGGGRREQGGQVEGGESRKQAVCRHAPVPARTGSCPYLPGMHVQRAPKPLTQSRAFSSQLWNRFSLTYEGTQYVFSLLASSCRGHGIQGRWQAPQSPCIDRHARGAVNAASQQPAATLALLLLAHGWCCVARCPAAAHLLPQSNAQQRTCGLISSTRTNQEGTAL